MVMPARVADAQGRDVLCGEGAAGMQPLGIRTAADPKRRLRFENLWSVLFSPA